MYNKKNEENEKKDTSEYLKKQTASRVRILIKCLLPLLVLCAGIAGASYIKNSSSKPRRQPPPANAPFVQTQTAQISSEQVIIRAMGTVIPAREMLLKSRTSGEIIAVHSEFIPGGCIMAGEEILEIDPRDYELAVTQKQSLVANALYALKIELGQQDIAKREWKLVNGSRPIKTGDRALVLRKPHLKKAKADLEAAKADLAQAKLNLARTKLTVPFNSIIKSKNVETGSQVSTGEKLAEIVNIDQYWIQISVPVDRLNWMKIPRTAEQSGSEVQIQYRNQAYERTGYVIRLLSELENEGRMARILVAVNDPLNIKNPENSQPPLLLGEYVRVKIKGRKLTDVFKIQRAALRNNNSIWVAGEKNKLLVRSVTILWRDKDSVLIKTGLEQGEKIIISDLSTPVDGMNIRVLENSNNPGKNNG